MRLATASLLLLICLASIEAGGSADTAAAERAASHFGHALALGDPSQLRSLLPVTGKIQLHLDRLGPESGAFSASQVEGLFKDFLRQGSVQSFQIQRAEGDGSGLALVCARLAITDREGRPAGVELRLRFQFEEGQWVMREIRETRP